MTIEEPTVRKTLEVGLTRMRPRSLRGEVSRRDAEPTENSWIRGSLRRSNESSDAVILLFAYVDKAKRLFRLILTLLSYGKIKIG